MLDPNMSAQEIRLHMGEMTAQEMRTARAAIGWANRKAVESQGPLTGVSVHTSLLAVIERMMTANDPAEYKELEALAKAAEIIESHYWPMEEPGITVATPERQAELDAIDATYEDRQVEISGKELLNSFVNMYHSGAQGCSMDNESAKALAEAILELLQMGLDTGLSYNEALAASKGGEKANSQDARAELHDVITGLEQASKHSAVYDQVTTWLSEDVNGGVAILLDQSTIYKLIDRLTGSKTHGL